MKDSAGEENTLPKLARKNMFEGLVIAITRTNIRVIIRRRISGIGMRFRAVFIVLLEKPPRS